MNEKKVMFLINIIKNTINVYFDTFFVFYFFKVANYEVIPLAKYYLIFYIFNAVGFFLIRNNMKKNIKVPYFQIGISLNAVFICLIMLLKEKIINYIFLVGFVKGIANGFFFFPKNILETEKITNEERQKYQGLLNIANQIVSIIIPLILGIALTYISYVNLGKIFFLLFIILFILSFYIKDNKYYFNKKFELKKFVNVIKKDKNIRHALLVCFLCGLSYSSGVMGLIITLIKINVFKTNLNLGFVDSVCALIFFIMSILYTTYIKKNNFSILSKISGIISFIVLLIFAFKPSIIILIIYLFVRNSFIGIMNLITNNVSNNLSNKDNIKEKYKPEYFFFKDMLYSLSRCVGYSILLIVCITLGLDYIKYILIISAISLLIEGLIIGNIAKNNR